MELKKILLSAVLSLLFSLSCLAQGSGYSIAGGLITEDALIRPVEFRNDSICEGRGTGTGGGFEAAAWIIRRFKDAGVIPFGSYSKAFRYDGVTGHNVIGICPSSTPSDRYVIIAAHYDNIGVLSGHFYPGADSNASGVSVLVNLADVFCRIRESGGYIGCNLIFVALDGKQQDMAGAQALFDSMSGGAFFDPYNHRMVSMDRVKMMVNIDIIGSTLEPVRRDRKDYLIMLSNDTSLQSAMSAINMMHEPSMDLSFDYYGSKDFTDLFLRRIGDQKVFVEHGVPSVLFTSGITMNTNKVDDTSATIDYPILKRRTQLIFRWLETMMRSR